VFVGPFTASAGRAVATNEADFDDHLDELVHASLVAADTAGPETRYRLLDTVRRFALDRLEARHGGVSDAYDRFVDHVLARSRDLMTGAASSWRPELLRDLVASYDNVAEALRWCIAHDDSPRRSHLLCSALWGTVHQAHADDITDLMRRVIARFPEVDSAGGAQARAVLATAEYVTGNPAIAVEIATSALADHPGPDITSVTLRRVLGQARNALGDRHGSIETFRDGARIGHELGMTAMAQELEVAAAIVSADLGATETGCAEIGAIVEAARSAGSVITASWAWAAYAWLLVRVDPAAALDEADGALDEARRLEYPIAVAVDLRSKAFAQLLLGDTRGAAETVAELLEDLLARGALSNLRILADVTAALAFRCDHPDWERLAATARVLPITTLASSQFEVIPLPVTDARPLSRRDLLDSVRAALADIASASMSRATSGEPAVTTASIRVRGDLCEVDFEGRAVSLRISKGVTDIVRLVAAGGRELHCTELAEASVEQSSTGEVIDAKARRQYEDRVRDLQSDIDEAEADNDYARSYRSQVELDAIIDHLAASLGRGQRTRRGVDNTERARSAVTHRVRSLIRQLIRVHPALGRHFEHSINTGVYCSYRPERPVAWTVESS
jgi:hypothetical protein